MSQTAVIGFPRIGNKRELKYATEGYFKGRLSSQDLYEKAAKLRKDQWLLQRQHGIDFIPSNDFSYYDGVLDTAVLLNAIPQRYSALGQNELDTYFAMARGYQDKRADVRALPMKKWFNTNYHYLVPTLDETTELRPNGSRPFEQYLEARAFGVDTTPVLLGPFTFLMLADCQGNKHKTDFIADLIEAYKAILGRFQSIGARWVQIDEPALVTDLKSQEISLFVSLYTEILKHRNGLKVLLQTYFGDIRDAYQEIAALGFDGIGLDFIEGKRTLDLIRTNGFPKDTVLFAGVVNGKNIWRNNYEKTLRLLHELETLVETKELVISTSCSLLHVPYSLENETSLDASYKHQFSFAQEKLGELSKLRSLFDDPDYINNEGYLHNLAQFKSQGQDASSNVRKRMSLLTGSDFVRQPVFDEREKLQQATLQLPLLPTTTIGSFPQTPSIQTIRRELKGNRLSTEVYKRSIKNKIAECVALQEEIGLDVLVHGEYERNDMVEYFGENLKGFLFTQNAWVQSYGTRCVKPPIIWGDIERTQPITVEYSVYAQSLTTKPVKGMLTGPVTILNWSFPREDISNREIAMQIALALKEEVADLEANGIRIIQIDEAALREKLPLRHSDWHTDYLDWAIPAFRLAHAAVKPTTQIHTHMCYSEFEDIIEDIDAMDADVITFEASRSGQSIVNALDKAHFRTQVGPGVYDIHSPRVPSQDEIRGAIVLMLNKIQTHKLWINPDCGLKTRGEDETIASLKNLVAAAKSIRSLL